MPLGIYISVPFCRSKCSYCNFASDVFSKAVFERYVERLCADIANAENTAMEMGGRFDHLVDSIYLGGGTPTVLDAAQLERVFAAVRAEFEVGVGAEITVECAPGTLSDVGVASLLRCGVNRVSLGVQSFVDAEAAAVGRLHKRTTVLDDIARLRAAGISNINVDLIAGLPHQNAASWDVSVAEAIATDVPHVSVYMLEVDEDSRLGREVIAGGTRYHAHEVPEDDASADFYESACERLEAAGIAQYEISNFARGGFESRHNLKYWTRQPYFGFGVDAHSMLVSSGMESVRFSSPNSLERYVAEEAGSKSLVSCVAAFEERFFLGLRLNCGVDLMALAAEFGEEAVSVVSPVIADCVEAGMLWREGDVIGLTSRGRMVSNEVFEKFVGVGLGADAAPEGVT